MRQTQKHLCESEAFLGYRASSRTARATQRNPTSKNQNKKRKKKKTQQQTANWTKVWFQVKSQEKREKLHCRKNFILKTLPVTNHGHQLVGASCTEEFQSQFIFEHSYSVMDSPKKLKHKLDHVIIELENTKESLQNVLNREKHFQKSLRKTIRELKDECLISQETANRLDAFCWECCESTE
ncbi:THAP domain-containing protein 6 isoform X3 [Alexandromys fortis]|uniref:THAP domain-containing protein 6 isoform X3 n=1 Tax=Alexandromys fortis TaxID=100897 RepID=UPI002153538F|nr:THAP domain-containing protein 6 isoform X3 [Microtus fortis]